MTVTIKIYKDLSNSLDPNCYTIGRDGNQVLMLCCHNTAGPNDFNGTSATTAQALSDTAARYLAGNDRQASVQWLVGAEACGAPIYRIVKESDTAYQCGGNPPQYPSSWKDPTTGKVYGGFGLNEVSIGIELFGQTTDVLGPNQKASLQSLVKDIVSRYPILLDPMRIVAHKELESDRSDGMNWRDLARGVVKAMANTIPPALAPGIGPGMTLELKNRGLTPATKEVYTTDITSVLYCTDGTKLEAYRNVDPAVGTLLNTWTVLVYPPK